MIDWPVRGAMELKNDNRAKEANEYLNVVPESEEMREAMKETRESISAWAGWSKNQVH